jgi:hypothetical protein
MNVWVCFWCAVAHHLQEQFDWFVYQRHLSEDASGVVCGWGVPIEDDIRQPGRHCAGSWRLSPSLFFLYACNKNGAFHFDHRKLIVKHIVKPRLVGLMPCLRCPLPV